MSPEIEVRPEPPTLDGRRRGGQDSRARIVAAMMEIIDIGEVASAERVAPRADVGLRTVFRRFQDMDSLYREIGAVVGRRVHAILGAARRRSLAGPADRDCRPPGPGLRRHRPFKRAADVFRHRSRHLGSDYPALVVELRDALIRHLPLEALDLLLSFEAWSRLRREQDLSVARAQAVLETAVRRLIA